MKRLPGEFMTEITAILKKNLGWKIFSIIIAFCLWFVIINITDPIEVWTFSMKLNLAGADKLMETSNVVVQNQKALESSTVTAKIRGNRMALETLNKNRSGLTASVNLGIIYDFSLKSDVLAPIDIIIPPLPGVTADKFDIVSKNPQYAKITLEDIVTEERNVKVMTQGEPENSYIALIKEVNPQIVNITGARSKVELVDTVLVEAPISDATKDANLLIKPKLLDRDMNEVTDVECEEAFVAVHINIEKNKRVPVTASTVGEPAEGYTVTNIECSPRNLEIVGNDEVVDLIEGISLIPVNVAGLSVTNTHSFDVEDMKVLPEGVSIRNGTSTIVNVTVTIEETAEKRLRIPASLINTGSDASAYKYALEDDYIDITVKGAKSKLTELNENSVKLFISLAGKPVGSNTIPIRLELPPGIEHTNDMPVVRVNIMETPLSQEADSQ